MYKKISAKPILRKSLGRHKIKIKPKKFLHSILNESIPFFFFGSCQFSFVVLASKKKYCRKNDE